MYDLLTQTEMDQSLPGHNTLCLKNFSPATSTDAPDGTIVLQKDYLILPKDSKYGMPGFFQSPVDGKSLQNPSYNLVTNEISFAGYDIIRCIVTPGSDITIIPINLQGYEDSTTDEVRIERTRYILESYEENLSYIKSGYRVNVKLNLVLRSARDLTQKFQIDGAVLLDPGLQPQLLHSSRPVCLLGMDFIMKYQYLFYVPRFDSCGMVDFMISRDPFASRPYSVHEQFYKTVVVHVDGYHDEDTGNIGCGVFFKSGSVFNMLSGVSKYDKAGTKHTQKLKERGILMAIIKALHIVRAFPVGRDFRGIIIKSTDPAISRLMAVTQVTMRNVFTDSKKSGEGSFDPMEGGYYYPTANRDLMLYFCHTFLRTDPGFKITFEDSKNCSEAVAAGLLATIGAQMKEFCVEREKGLPAEKGSYFSQTYSKRVNKANCPNITLLENCVGFEEGPLYINLGFDGYFYIQQEKAHATMEAADAAGLNPEGSAGCGEKFATLGGKLLVRPNVLANTEESLEKGLTEVVYKKQNLQEDTVKAMKPHKGEPHKQDQIFADYTGYMECAEEGDMLLARLNRNLNLGRKRQELGLFQETQGLTVTDTNAKAKGNDGTCSALEGVKERIHADAKVKISLVKDDRLFKYEFLERQMAARIARIKEEGREKRRKIIKETDVQIAATTAEYSQKRNAIVNETRALIKEINTTTAQEIKMAWYRVDPSIGGKQMADMQKADDGNRKLGKPLAPSNYIFLSEFLSKPTEEHPELTCQARG